MFGLHNVKIVNLGPYDVYCYLSQISLLRAILHLTPVLGNIHRIPCMKLAVFSLHCLKRLEYQKI